MIDRRKVLMIGGAILLCAALAEVLFLLTHREARQPNLVGLAVAGGTPAAASHRDAHATTPNKIELPSVTVPDRDRATPLASAAAAPARLPRGDDAPMGDQYAALLAQWHLDDAQRAEFLRRVTAFRFAEDEAGQAAARAGLMKFLANRFSEFENFERERPVREVVDGFAEFAASRSVAVTPSECARIAALASPSNVPPPTTSGTLAAATGADGQFSLARHAEGQIAASYALYDKVSAAAEGVFSRAQRAALDIYLGERILEDETTSRATAIVGGMLLETNRVDLRPARP